MRKFIIFLFCLWVILVGNASAALRIQEVQWSPNPFISEKPFTITVNVTENSNNHTIPSGSYVRFADTHVSNDLAIVPITNGTATYTPTWKHGKYVTITAYYLDGKPQHSWGIPIDVDQSTILKLPEFPTVAVPVAVIMVLLIIFSKKKG